MISDSIKHIFVKAPKEGDFGLCIPLLIVSLITHKIVGILRFGGPLGGGSIDSNVYGL
jgi:hypothetical protein